jgi:hypothetical protein
MAEDGRKIETEMNCGKTREPKGSGRGEPLPAMAKMKTPERWNIIH